MPYFSGNPWDQQPDESEEAFQAFREYISQPANTHKNVAAVLGKSHDLIRRWSSRHSWLDRRRQYNNFIYRQQDTQFADEMETIRQEVQRRELDDGNRLRDVWLGLLESVENPDLTEAEAEVLASKSMILSRLTLAHDRMSRTTRRAARMSQSYRPQDEDSEESDEDTVFQVTDSGAQRVLGPGLAD